MPALPLSVEPHEVSPGVFKARQENLGRQMKGKSVQGAQHKPEEIFRI